MAFERGIGGSDPVRSGPVARLADTREARRPGHSWRLGTGTLACPSCDAPVALAPGGVAPADPLGCSFCGHGGAVRDFLSLGEPSRPARVEVRVVQRS